MYIFYTCASHARLVGSGHHGTISFPSLFHQTTSRISEPRHLTVDNTTIIQYTTQYHVMATNNTHDAKYSQQHQIVLHDTMYTHCYCIIYYQQYMAVLYYCVHENCCCCCYTITRVYLSSRSNRRVDGRSIVVKVNCELSNLDLRSVFSQSIYIQEVESSWRPVDAREIQSMIRSFLQSC